MSAKMAKLLCFAFLLAFASKIHGVELSDAKNTISRFFTESKDGVSNEGTDTSKERMEISEERSDMLVGRIPIECLSDPDRGPCTEKIPRWNYNSRKDKCYKFWYGGCEGNGNNFFSKEECEIVCLNERKLGDRNQDRRFCHNNGRQPYFRSCTKYVFCLNQIGYIMKCPPGLHFNAKTANCVTPCAAFCDPDFACICKWKKCVTDVFKCPQKNGNFANLMDCARYFECKDYKPIPKQCPVGQLFDSKAKICVPWNEATCYHSTDVELNIPPTYKCPEKNGNFSVSMDCKKYIDCKNSKPTPKECPEGKTFDSKKKICVPWYEAICYHSTEGELIFPLNFKCPQRNGNFSVPLDCTKYIDCKDSKSTPKECPRGNNFDSKNKICVPWYEAFCYQEKLVETDRIKDHIPCSPEGNFPYRPNCKKYIRCLDTWLTLEDCPKDKSFDYIKRTCVPDAEARCYH